MVADNDAKSAGLRRSQVPPFVSANVLNSEPFVGIYSEYLGDNVFGIFR